MDKEPTETYDICKICFWEDDGVQYSAPDEEGGAKIPSSESAIILCWSL
ncbi:CPCC family cysteine-rich protein [Peribacillus simplex]